MHIFYMSVTSMQSFKRLLKCVERVDHTVIAKDPKYLKLENCVCKTQVMPLCPKPVLIPYPIPTHDLPSHSIYTGDKCLKCRSQNFNNFVKNYTFVCKVTCTPSICMDGWMTCDFTSFSTVFQPYQDDERLIMKGCVQWSPVYG